ncbi:hypothetical protein LDENG_00233400 [Lucifuga dentata]|nr:hypothetical protein LDENG_00233400 [Lucifuga dentata]
MQRLSARPPSGLVISPGDHRAEAVITHKHTSVRLIYVLCPPLVHTECSSYQLRHSYAEKVDVAFCYVAVEMARKFRSVYLDSSQIGGYLIRIPFISTYASAKTDLRRSDSNVAFYRLHLDNTRYDEQKTGIRSSYVEHRYAVFLLYPPWKRNVHENK